jgi:type III secretion protein O
MSVFDELLAIKRFREGQAELAVARQRRRMVEADAAREQAKIALESYQRQAYEHEQAMYGELYQRLVRVREIEQVLESVAQLRAGERDHEAALKKAVEMLEEETRNLQSRRDDHQQAVRMTGKFVELARVYLDEFLKALEQKEDLEMEEAVTVARDREDWEQHEEYEPA